MKNKIGEMESKGESLIDRFAQKAVLPIALVSVLAASANFYKVMEDKGIIDDIASSMEEKGTCVTKTVMHGNSSIATVTSDCTFD